MNKPANLGMNVFNILLIGGEMRLFKMFFTTNSKCEAFCCSETSQVQAQGFTNEGNTLNETPGPQSRLQPRNNGETARVHHINNNSEVKSNTVNRRNNEKQQRNAENNQIESNKTLKTTDNFIFLT